MAEVRNGGNYSYENYNVSAQKGLLYQSSKTPKEGYEKVVTQSGTVTYHRYVKAVTGYITKVTENEANFPSGVVKQLVVNVLDKETNTIQVIQISLFNTKKYYNNATIAMLKVLPNVDKNKEVSVGFYISKYTKNNGEEGTNLNASISYIGEKTEDGKPLNVQWIDLENIPKGELVVKRGENTYDFEKRDDHYYNILQDVKEKFKFEQNNSPSQKDVKKEIPVNNNVEDGDNLPF